MMADTYKPYISGVTNCIALSQQTLCEWGHQAVVFTLGHTRYTDGEADVVRSPAIPLLNTGFSLGLSYSRPARDRLRTMEVIHVHHPFLSGRLALRYRGGRNIPLVFTNHTRYDLYAQAYLPFIPSAFSRFYLGRALARFCAECDLVIAPSAGLKKVLRSFDVQTDIEVIPNGVDLTLHQRAPGDRHRPEFGLSDSDTILIYLGRIGPEKNLHFLLRAFALARPRASNLKLLVVGGGPRLAQVKTEVRRLGLENVARVAGPVPYADVPDVLALADIFATASTTEVHPLSLIEALASGLPAIGVTSPGIEDTIVDGQNGFLCARDEGEFAERIVQLSENVELRRRMAAEARCSAEKYDVRRTVAATLRHYERLIEQRRDKT
jgi:glycosyltransferase involved in cell wall biosynthesis